MSSIQVGASEEVLRCLAIGSPGRCRAGCALRPPQWAEESHRVHGGRYARSRARARHADDASAGGGKATFGPSHLRRRRRMTQNLEGVHPTARSCRVGAALSGSGPSTLTGHSCLLLAAVHAVRISD